MELCHTPDADAVPSADVERIIELRFKRLCDGFEVAFAQLPLQCQPVLDAMSIDEPLLAGGEAESPPLPALGTHGGLPGGSPPPPAAPPLAAHALVAPVCVDDAGAKVIMLSAGRTRVALSRATGLPVSLTYDGVERLAAPVEPSLWRPLNDNELGSGQHLRLRKWRMAGRCDSGGYLRLLSPPRVGPGVGGGVGVASEAELTPNGDTTMSSLLTLLPSGALIVQCTVTPCEKPMAVANGGTTDGAATNGAAADGDGRRARPLFNEAAIMLRSGAADTPDGRYLDCEREAVRARWDDPGNWQQLVVRHAPMAGKVSDGGEVAKAAHEGQDLQPICYGDIITLTAHNSRYIAASREGILARRSRLGEYGPRPPDADECFLIERVTDEAATKAGGESAVGKSSPIGAPPIPSHPRPVCHGDAIRLRACAAVDADAISGGCCYLLSSSKRPMAPTAAEGEGPSVSATSNASDGILTLGTVDDASTFSGGSDSSGNSKGVQVRIALSCYPSALPPCCTRPCRTPAFHLRLWTTRAYHTCMLPCAAVGYVDDQGGG